MNRRDLLKLFGVGAVAAPVIGGVVETSAMARIIEPPKVELYRPVVKPVQKIPGAGVNGYDITVSMVNRSDQSKRYDFTASGIVVDAKPIYVDVTNYSDTHRKFQPCMVRGEIRISVQPPFEVVAR